MKQLLPVLASFCLFVAIPNKSEAVHRVDSPIPIENTLSELTVEDILHASRKEKEEKIGRKLKLKEQIALWLVKKKIKKQLKKSSKNGNDGARTDGYALAGFITGIVGSIFLPFIGGFFAILLGIWGLGRIKKNPQKKKGKGFAIAAIILGAIGFLGWTIALLAWANEPIF